MNWETLLSWGDSITIGARSYLAYPECAADALAKQTNKYWHAPIHAVCGFTVSDLNRSLTPELQNFVAMKPSLLTIMIGTNDLKSPTSVESFEIAYRQILIKAHMVCDSRQILLLSIPELKQGVMYPYQISMNASVHRFNAAINRLAEEFGVRTLSIKLDADHLYDGVHLSDVGSTHAGQQVADFVLADRGLVPNDIPTAIREDSLRALWPSISTHSDSAIPRNDHA